MGNVVGCPEGVVGNEEGALDGCDEGHVEGLELGCIVGLLVG